MTDGAPKLAPGTPMTTRKVDGVAQFKTKRSLWHSLKWWLGHHMDREKDGEWKDLGNGWEQHTVTRRTRRKTDTRENLRDEMRLAKHAQDLRAESVALGGREETQRYYGKGEFGTGSVGYGEARTSIDAAEKQRAAHEAAEKEKYDRPRRRGIRW